MRESSKELCRKLGFEFSNPKLLEAALSHRSAKGENNERLEFLGDSLINFIIAAALFNKFPKAREGQLSRLRANLVNGETLSEVATEFGLGAYLRLGAGEQKSGGHKRVSILADAMEAIIGAIYLDGGLETCRTRVLDWFASRLDNISMRAIHKDAKTQLQEYLQANKLPLPIYNVEMVEGADHQQQFHVRCEVSGLDKITLGQGSNRRKAEQQAAQLYLEYLTHERD